MHIEFLLEEPSAEEALKAILPKILSNNVTFDFLVFAEEAGFVTKSNAAPNESFQVVNRLAIEELEAWFFGDIEALHVAYSRVSINLQYQARYRDPDAIRGGTYEALERLLIRAHYYTGKLPKTEVAQNIAQHTAW